MRVRDLPPHLQARARAALKATAPRPRGPAAPALPDPAVSSAPTSDVGPLVLTVPMPPNVTNRESGRSHWSVRHRERTELHDALDVRAAAGLIPPPPAAPLRRVWARSVMVLHGAMDDDNAVARHKHLIDWLVSRRYLASDRRTCLRWAAFPEQRVTRREDPTITLTITPREDQTC